MKISKGAFLVAIGTLLSRNTSAFADYAYTELHAPGAVQAAGGTLAFGISGSTVVGVYNSQGFSETNGVYTNITVPGAAFTIPRGITGGTIVGYYSTRSNSITHGFSETGGVYTTLDDPLASASGFGNFIGTHVLGISGNTVVGYYSDAAGAIHGFSEAGGVYTTLDDPLAEMTSGNGTFIYGMSGDTVVGQYDGTDGNNHGFSETDGVFTTTSIYPFAISGDAIAGWTLAFSSNPPGITEPGAIETNGVIMETSDPSYVTQNYIYGIDGTTIVGEYLTAANDGEHSFIATLEVPEPASLGLFACGTLVLLLRRRWLA